MPRKMVITLKKLFAIAILTIAILCAGCGGDKEMVIENGKGIIDLPPGEKLVNFAGSRYADYVIHRKRRSDESLEEYTVDKIAGGDMHSAAYIIREH